MFEDLDLKIGDKTINEPHAVLTQLCTNIQCHTMSSCQGSSYRYCC